MRSLTFHCFPLASLNCLKNFSSDLLLLLGNLSADSVGESAARCILRRRSCLWTVPAAEPRCSCRPAPDRSAASSARPSPTSPTPGRGLHPPTGRLRHPMRLRLPLLTTTLLRDLRRVLTVGSGRWSAGYRTGTRGTSSRAALMTPSVWNTCWWTNFTSLRNQFSCSQVFNELLSSPLLLSDSLWSYDSIDWYLLSDSIITLVMFAIFSFITWNWPLSGIDRFRLVNCLFGYLSGVSGGIIIYSGKSCSVRTVLNHWPAKEN